MQVSNSVLGELRRRGVSRREFVEFCAYAYAHREWMMRISWGDLVVQALECVAAREKAIA